MLVAQKHWKLPKLLGSADLPQKTELLCTIFIYCSRGSRVTPSPDPPSPVIGGPFGVGQGPQQCFCCIPTGAMCPPPSSASSTSQIWVQPASKIPAHIPSLPKEGVSKFIKT